MLCFYEKELGFGVVELNHTYYALPSIRYDYFYKKDELEFFVEPIKKVSKKTKKTLIFFNNCHAGSAAKNAIQLAKMLNS